MFSVVTHSQFQLPEIFISQLDRGSIALSLRWVSVKRGVGIGVSVGVGFYLFFLKNAVLGLGLRLVSTPRFIDGPDNIDLEGNFEKKNLKIRLKSFEIVTTFRYKRRIIKLFYIKKLTVLVSVSIQEATRIPSTFFGGLKTSRR